MAAQQYQPLAFVPSVVLPLSLTVTSRQTWEPSKKGRATCSLFTVEETEAQSGLREEASGSNLWTAQISDSCLQHSTSPHPTPNRSTGVVIHSTFVEYHSLPGQF